jgi:hypothetical protein
MMRRARCERTKREAKSAVRPRRPVCHCGIYSSFASAGGKLKSTSDSSFDAGEAGYGERSSFRIRKWSKCGQRELISCSERVANWFDATPQCGETECSIPATGASPESALR